MAHFLQYWKTAEKDQLIDFAASSQFGRRVEAGDTLWIVTLSKGELFLLGYLHVEELLTRSEFIKRNPSRQPYLASYIAVPGGDPVKAKAVSIQRLASQLRFESKQDRLVFDKPLGNQLQSLRKLQSNSASLLETTFAQSRATDAASLGTESAIFDKDVFHEEGRTELRVSMRRVRSQRLVNEKKRDVLRRFGKLLCEVCDFDYQAFYGLGNTDCFECHHLSPLGKQAEPVRNGTKDLILICSNCHTVAHKGSANHTRKALFKIRTDLKKRNLLFSDLLA